jgi:hypothetical protein
MTGTTEIIAHRIIAPKLGNLLDSISLAFTASHIVLNVAAQFMQASRQNGQKNIFDGILMDDNLNCSDLLDTRKYANNKNQKVPDMALDIPSKISGTYTEDYNILYLDDIIKKKLTHEKYGHVQKLRDKVKQLKELIQRPQTYISRETTLQTINETEHEITQIESGNKLRIYEEKVRELLVQYKQYSSKTKKIVFSTEDMIVSEMDEVTMQRVIIIEQFLAIARKYIDVDIIHVVNCAKDMCKGCGTSLMKIAANEDGIIRCPNLECQIEYSIITNAKVSKDSTRVNSSNNTADESIENFLRSFIHYNGLQTDKPDPSLYLELDDYFIKNDKPSGEEIRNLTPDDEGRKGETSHQMMLYALQQLGHSEYYKDVNLIMHNYWGYDLPNTMHLKDRIVSDYHKTQKVFYQIPAAERGRDSSLGTQYRLWRHLQLLGVHCDKSQFKIAENAESLRTHDRLWRRMCSEANDPDIYYIP